MKFFMSILIVGLISPAAQASGCFGAEVELVRQEFIGEISGEAHKETEVFLHTHEYDGPKAVIIVKSLTVKNRYQTFRTNTLDANLIDVKRFQEVVKKQLTTENIKVYRLTYELVTDDDCTGEPAGSRYHSERYTFSKLIGGAEFLFWTTYYR